MATATERFVPKIHPANRPVEPEDPMSLHATSVAGDPEIMLQCLVHEYAWLGWDADHILGLFRDPFYPALNNLLQQLGEDRIRQRLHEILSSLGILHFEEVLQDDGDAKDETQMVELGVPQSWKSNGPIKADNEGVNHARGI